MHCTYLFMNKSGVWGFPAFDGEVVWEGSMDNKDHNYGLANSDNAMSPLKSACITRIADSKFWHDNEGELGTKW